MEPSDTYERYPARLVAVAVLVNVSIYVTGAYALSGFGVVATAAYALFCLAQEIRIMRHSCVDCYYYGKRCGLGRGNIASLLFRQGDPARFLIKEISWRQLLPDVMVLLIPLAGGIVLLFQAFSRGLVAALAILVTGSLWGNYLVRSKIACRFCKQRETGCPAERFFGGTAIEPRGHEGSG